MKTGSRALLINSPLPLLLLCIATLTGCANWSYDKFQLGQLPSDYERILPLDSSRKTALGLCHLKKAKSGRTDALVVLLTEDRRVAAKISARHIPRDWLGRDKPGFELIGRLDPNLYGVAGSGPLDTLRAVVGDLTDYRGEKFAVDTHAWIAAGLIRLMQSWSEVQDVGVSSQRLKKLLELVPGGGVGRIETDNHGIYHMEYKQGHLP